MLIVAKKAASCSTNWFLHRSAVQWKKSLMLYSNAAAKRASLLRSCPEATATFGLGRTQTITLPALSLMPIRAQHESKQFNPNINFTSSSDYEDKSFQDGFKETLLNENDIFRQHPQNRNRFGVLKAVLIIIAGTYFGAWCAMIGAYVLEELEIFVDDDDDED